MPSPLEKLTNAPDHPYYTDKGYARWEKYYDQIQNAYNLISHFALNEELSPITVITLFADYQVKEVLARPITLVDLWHFGLWMADIHLHHDYMNPLPASIRSRHERAAIIKQAIDEYPTPTSAYDRSDQ